MQIRFAWSRSSFQQQLWSDVLSFRLGLVVAAAIVALPLQVQAHHLDRVFPTENRSTAANLGTNLSQTATVKPKRIAQSTNTPQNITGVKLKARDSALEVILETAGTISAPTPKIIGNLLYFDLPNATIAQPFRAANPAQGIENVSVTQVDAGYVRVTVVGSNGTPQATVVAGAAGTTPEPVAQQTNDPELEINVIGGLRDSYRKPNAASVTGTNTPIIETPFSVQVIPQTIIRDRQSRDVKDAIGNVSGVTYNGNSQGLGGETFIIRGFSDSATLRDGFKQYGSGAGQNQPVTEIANLEQVEILKGPASILYGAIEPGGLINLVSKKPLSTPFYEVEVKGGSRNLISPRFDVSGPLTADGKVLYRVNGLYQSTSARNSTQQPDQKTFIAPTIAWKVGDKTDLTISAEYIDSNRPGDFGLPVIGTSVANVPRERITNEPSDRFTNQFLNIGNFLQQG